MPIFRDRPPKCRTCNHPKMSHRSFKGRTECFYNDGDEYCHCSKFEPIEEKMEEPVCVIDICKGFCCENIANIVKINLEKMGLNFEPNGKGEFRCMSHDKEKGTCRIYDRRTWYCKMFFCPSAERGFMRNALKHMPNATVNKGVR
jgi:hypothetical protein